METIINTGNSYIISDLGKTESKLPLGTYTTQFNARTNSYFLQKIEEFSIPNKVYGDFSIIDRSISIYKEKSDKNFGILLSGLRGAGKSLTMKKLAIELNQPIIIIDNYMSDFSNAMISLLTNPLLGDCTILFDEFEKKFEDSDSFILDLLDGVYSKTHHFFILTINKTLINENLTNRPGRIYYHIKYSGLSQDLIEEVVDDLLIDKSKKEELLEELDNIANISFDMLLSIIHDVNKFNDSPKLAISYFGFTKETKYITLYKLHKGERIILNTNIIYDKNNIKNGYWINDEIYYNDKKYNPSCFVDYKYCKKVSKNLYKYEFTYKKLSELDDVLNGKLDTDIDIKSIIYLEINTVPQITTYF